ncbi:MAG: MerR family transcriptional regulator [Polaromonas sp.]
MITFSDSRWIFVTLGVFYFLMYLCGDNFVQDKPIVTHECLTIATVSEQTCIAKEVLRKWEMRYGFPLPARDATGHRLYPVEQTRRLKLIKKLLDDGMRPRQIVPLAEERLAMLLAERCAAGAHPPASDLTEKIVQWLQARDPRLLREQLHAELAWRGWRDFILYAMPALNAAVGNAWSRGDISVMDEHLYAETVQALIRQGIFAYAGVSGPPRILLTTPPGELHTLGILMVEALMTLEGATCISLGAQMPLPEIASASRAYQADIVVLSFSTAFPRKKILPLLRELRSLCPSGIEVWACGSGVARLDRALKGITVISTLGGALNALQKLSPLITGKDR